MKEKIDVDRCRRAMVDVNVEGAPTGQERLAAIEAAINMIQTDGDKALTGEYVGVKSYAGFGDQREDHSYGCGPRHGTIVFRIGRVSGHTVGRPVPKLGADHVYLLECVRDFGVLEGYEEGRPHDTGVWRPSLNLCDVLDRVADLTTRLNHLSTVISKGEVESHEGVGNGHREV